MFKKNAGESSALQKRRLIVKAVITAPVMRQNILRRAGQHCEEPHKNTIFSCGQGGCNRAMELAEGMGCLQMQDGTSL